MGFAAKGVLRWGEAVSPPGMVWGEESGGADVLCRLWAPGGKDGMKAEKSHSHHPVELCRSVGWAAPPLHGVDPCAAAHPLSLGHQSQSIGDVMSWGHFPKEQSPLSPLPPPPPGSPFPSGPLQHLPHFIHSALYGMMTIGAANPKPVCPVDPSALVSLQVSPWRKREEMKMFQR